MKDCKGFLQPRDVVCVAGADAASYLQSQISQDIDSLPVGHSVWSLILSPRGKLDAWFRLSRRAGDFLLDVDYGFGAVLLERLLRFKLRVDVTAELLAGFSMISVRWLHQDMNKDSSMSKSAVGATNPVGDSFESADVGSADVESADVATNPADGEIGSYTAPTGVQARAMVDWASFQGEDLLGPDLTMPDDLTAFTETEFEIARIQAGWPVMGKELTERTIPAEVPGLVKRSVSFTKGCYTGQELVARIDSRGNNVPRPIRFLEIDAMDVDSGDEVVVDGVTVGEVTSVAVDQNIQKSVALGVVHRRVQPPASALVKGHPAVVMTPQVLV